MWGAGVPSRPQSAGGPGTHEGGYVGASSLSLLHMLSGFTPDNTPRLAPLEAPRYTFNLLPWRACNKGNYLSYANCCSDLLLSMSQQKLEAELCSSPVMLFCLL